MTDTRTIVTVHKAGTTINDTIRYDADWFSVEDGTLTVERTVQGQVTSGGFAIAAWAPGTWARAEITEEPTPGTFEVYEDATGNYQFNLRDGDGEYLASGQGYALRKNAVAGVAAVQRAAKGAPIVDVDQ